MSDSLPRTTNRVLQFANGEAIGMSQRWERGQYCSILTKAGIVGCGIYDLQTAAEFGQAIAIAKGTPSNPLVEPEDLFEAPIVAVTPQAAALGIQPGMPGREAVERMLAAESAPAPLGVGHPLPIGVRAIDHVTMVVADLKRSAEFYVDLLGMTRVPRPAFKFDGAWFQAGSTQVHLILAHDGSAPPGFPVPPGAARPGGTFHFAFEVADCREATDRLKAASVPIRGGPSLRPDGCLQTWCHDPDGHVVEVFSRR